MVDGETLTSYIGWTIMITGGYEQTIYLHICLTNGGSIDSTACCMAADTDAGIWDTLYRETKAKATW